MTAFVVQDTVGIRSYFYQLRYIQFYSGELVFNWYLSCHLSHSWGSFLFKTKTFNFML